MNENQRELNDIAAALIRLAAAVEKQNELLNSCMILPDGKNGRVVVGISGAVNVVDL